MGPVTVELSSRLPATQDAVWSTITTFDGINHELWPYLRMTVPPELREANVTAVVPGRRLFRSRLLLGGVLPVGHSDVTVVELWPGIGFLERSPMTGLRHWQHERRITPIEDGCVITDRLTFEPLRGLPAQWVRPVVAALFRHRHRRLRGQFTP